MKNRKFSITLDKILFWVYIQNRKAEKNNLLDYFKNIKQKLCQDLMELVL